MSEGKSFAGSFGTEADPVQRAVDIGTLFFSFGQ